MYDEKSFWDGVIRDYKNHRCLVERGILYAHNGISREDAKWRGYCGRKWTITFTDGTVVKTNDLWHSRDIPESLKGVLVDNCTVKEGW